MESKSEAQLAIDAKERRTHFVLEQPRNLKYFDDVYELAESTYNTSLNWPTTPQNVSFINFQYTVEQQDKIYRLFFDHDINFDKFDQVIEYYFVKIQLDTTSLEIEKLLERIQRKIAKL